ncbi:MAG: hypothetical protein DWQ29_14460 [Planctomycetota bacterium]|nr:MAG: hypothetical protein DWQ29_14460 [Planctomycetota bacterium]
MIASRHRLPLAAFLMLASSLHAAEDAIPDFTADVAPLLTKYCAGCHNDEDRDGDFSLESFASLQQGTEDGPALLPGDPAGSRIIRVLAEGAEPAMPPEGEPRPSEEEIAILTAWIEAGAIGPEGAEIDRTILHVPVIESRTDTRPVSAVDWSADGRLIAVARYASVDVFSAPQEPGQGLGEPLQTITGFPGKVTAVHFSTDSSQIVAASGVAGQVGRASIFKTEDGSPVREFTGHRDILYDAELSPAGDVLATCSYDKQIILWNTRTGEPLRTLEGHNGAVYDVAFSPDGTALVSASADDTCKVWRVSDGERLDTLGQPLREQYAVAFSPDGNFIVAGGADNRIRVWRFVSREQPRINPLVYARFAHEGPIVALDFTPDGTRLVSVAEDRTVKLWETEHYSELRLYEEQPAVTMALSVGGNGRSFLLGRMDGSLQSLAIASDTNSESTEGPQTVAVVPMNDVGETTTAAESEPNDQIEQANAVSAPVNVTGVIESVKNDQSAEDAPPDSDLFRFSAKAGQEWVIEVNAARSGSQLDSFVEILAADGSRIERALLQAVRDSYFTFRGKDANTVDDFRVFNWEEMDLNQYLYSNGEVVKLWLYPRGPDSGFMVYPGKGTRWGWFDTTPLAHPLNEPCYIVEHHPPGTELIPNGLPVFTLHYENDDDARRELGADSRLYFTAPADGDYIVRIRDVRGYEGPEFKYTLAIRPRQPDFAVTLHGADPTVGAGGAKEFRVEARRIDRFDGPIRVDIAGLPLGFAATSPLVIQEGQLEAMGVITAATDAPLPTAENAKATQVTASAEIRGAEVTHDVNNLGEIKLGEKPKVLVHIEPDERGAQPVGVSPEGWPEYVIRPGETIMLQVRVEKNGYEGEVGFGKEGAGRNLPFGSFVDNVGLNGLLILSDLDRREFFITVAPWVPETTRTFHLNTGVEGGQASHPVVLHVRRDGRLAGE